MNPAIIGVGMHQTPPAKPSRLALAPGWQARVDVEGTTPNVALAAAKAALAQAGLTAGDLDLILVGTASPEAAFPATACVLQTALGARSVGSFDVLAAEAGFVVALSAADAYLRSGVHAVALVVGADSPHPRVKIGPGPEGRVTESAAGAFVLATGRPGPVLLGCLLSAAPGREPRSLQRELSGLVPDGGKVNHALLLPGTGEAGREWLTSAGAGGAQVHAPDAPAGAPNAFLPIALGRMMGRGAFAAGDTALLLAGGAGGIGAAAAVRWGGAALTVARVVVTGMGMITPVGLTARETWEQLKAGHSGITSITAFDTTGFPCTVASQIPGFDPERYLEKKEARRTGRFTQLALAAAREALDQSGLEISSANAYDVGVLVSSAIGGLQEIETAHSVLLRRGPERVSPFTVPMMISDMASGQIAIAVGAKGPNYSIASACASSAHSLGEAFEIVRRGDALAMLAGGAESTITPLALAGFCAIRAVSTWNGDPRGASRPFDLKRDGFVMGEGAAVLVLEALEHARQRGAPILAEMVGYAATADAYHITAPDPEGRGAARCMDQALRKAGLEAGAVSYINAHGTATPLGDIAETLAIKRVFGARAARIPVSSTKSMVGHLLGAAGAVEAAVCVWSLLEDVVHPTINLEYPDPQCDLDYVVEGAREVEVRVALSNSFGFGGHNATVVLQKYDAQPVGPRP